VADLEPVKVAAGGCKAIQNAVGMGEQRFPGCGERNRSWPRAAVDEAMPNDPFQRCELLRHGALPVSKFLCCLADGSGRLTFVRRPGIVVASLRSRQP
jgi:hypothetical protein